MLNTSSKSFWNFVLVITFAVSAFLWINFFWVMLPMLIAFLAIWMILPRHRGPTDEEIDREIARKAFEFRRYPE